MEEVNDDGGQYGDAADEGQQEVVVKGPKIKKRRPSERIMKQKLKKAVFDKDGRGASSDYPVDLE